MNFKQPFAGRSMIYILLSMLLGIVVPSLLIRSNVIFYQLVFTFLIYMVLRFYDSKKAKQRFEESTKDIIAFYENLDIPEKPYALRLEDFQSVNTITDAFREFLDSLKIIIQRQGGMITNYSEIQKELELNNRSKEAMLNINHQLLELDNENKLYSIILSECLSLLNRSGKGSFLIHDGHGQLDFKALKGYGNDDFKHLRIKLNESLLWIASNGKITTPVVINGLMEFNQKHMSNERYNQLKDSGFLSAKSVLSCPVIIDDEFFGMINLDSDEENAFSISDIRIMTHFTSQIGMVVKNHQLLQRIVQLSRFDKLTEIYNRSYFEELFLDYTKRTMRYREKFALVLCDLNHLKKINDSFGHSAGDKALKTFVSLLKEQIRETDFIARIGGDEFIIILHQNDYDQALEKMSTLQEKINKQHILYNNVQIPIRFSFGIATSPDESMIYDILSKIADDRMYENKRLIKQKNPTLLG